MISKRAVLLLVSALTLLATTPSMARTGHPTDAIGQPGLASAVDRSIEVSLNEMSFSAKSIEIQAGETIRFVLKNDGALLHEFNIGTAAGHAAHQHEMAAMLQQNMPTPTETNPSISGMDHAMPANKMDSHQGHASQQNGRKTATIQHKDANSVLVEPGATQELIWTFSSSTKLQFACNVPGHYQAGMVGDFIVQ